MTNAETTSRPVSRNPRIWIWLLLAGMAITAFLVVVLINKRVADQSERLADAPQGHRKNAPFIVTPTDVVHLMLDVSDLSQDDVLYDLGCGDARILIAAAKRYRCQCVGYEYDPEIADLARERVQAAGLEDLITIHTQDIFQIPHDELNRATVITLYLLDWMNNKLIPQLSKLDADKLIVSHDWGLKGIAPDRTERIISRDDVERREHLIHVWKTPLRVTQPAGGPDQ